MARRSGQIIKRGERKWLIRTYLGSDLETGKRKFLNRTVHGTRKDAEREVAEDLTAHSRGALVESTRLAVNQYLDRWLEEAAPKKRRGTTVRHYAEMLRLYVRPAIGRRRLSDLTVLDVQGMVDGLENREGRKLSPQTIRYAVAALSAALSQAVRWRLIHANPTRDVEIPKCRQREMKAMSSEQRRAFQKAAKGRRLEALFLLLLGTGLRPGEALGLRWRDVDLDARQLRVRQTLTRKRKGEPWQFQDPKTTKSKRDVPLPAMVTRGLEAHKAAQAREKLLYGPTYESWDLVFAAAHGQPLIERNVVRDFKTVLEKADLPRDFRLYDLRHTAATMMVATGAGIAAVSDQLGHSSTKMTLDVYTHSMEAQHEELTRQMDELLGG